MPSQDIPGELRQYFEASHIALALADVTEDNPLLLVNEPFRALTGYDDAEVIGRNCRMLQRDAENRQPRAKIRSFLEAGRQASVRTTILNFRKDGKPFVNLLYMSKLTSLSGRCAFFSHPNSMSAARNRSYFPPTITNWDGPSPGSARLWPKAAWSSRAR